MTYFNPEFDFMTNKRVFPFNFFKSDKASLMDESKLENFMEIRYPSKRVV